MEQETEDTLQERPPKILVVEDDTNLLHGIKAILQIDHYDVLIAENGRDALKIMHNQVTPPDLIISDIMMPYMDGKAFFKAVRQEPQWLDIQFIFLTAKSEKDDIQDGVGLGADDYVTKPYDPDYLRTTVRSRLERRFKLGLFHAGKIAQIKRNILTILNHEFRTPLTFVVAYADMLDISKEVDELKKNEEILSFLKGISSGAERLRNLIENFIALVELETGEAKDTINYRKQMIPELDSFLELAWNEVVQKTGAVQPCEIIVDDRVAPFAADHDYFKLAIRHLLDNAVKFSKPNDHIIIRVQPDGDRVTISIQDHGRGIPEHELEGIWQTFYQIDRQNYEDQGAGSGLAIVRGVIQLHGGTIDVESVYGEGSTFTIRLPHKAD